MKKNNSIDVIKFILSLFIIAFHCELMRDINATISRVVLVFTNMAVPLFFAFSGYFFYIKYKKDSTQRTVIKNYVIRFFMMWIVWQIIYLPFIIHKGNSSWFITYFVLGSYAHLWYLKASLFAVIIFTFLHKIRISEAAIAYVSFAIYFFGVTVLNFNNIIGNQLDASFIRNGLFVGFPLFFLGKMLAEHSNQFKWNNMTRLGFAICIIGYIMENFLIKNIGQVTYFMYPLTVFIVILSINNRKSVQGCYYRNLSTCIFLTHYGVFSIVSNFSRNYYMLNSVEIFILTTICTVSLSWALNKIRYLLKNTVIGRFLNLIL